MKIIVRNGLNSKNMPENTLNGFRLALETSYIDGIEVSVTLTKDYELVVYSDTCLYHHPKHQISTLNYSELMKYNLGSKICKQRIITLKELLILFRHTSKLLVIHLNTHGINNSILVEKLVNHLKQYSNDNVYLKSACKEIIMRLKDYTHLAKVGAVITDDDPYFWNLNLDFYAINVQQVPTNSCKCYASEQMKEHHAIMLEEIDDVTSYQSVCCHYGDEIVSHAYLITTKAVVLAKLEH